MEKLMVCIIIHFYYTDKLVSQLLFLPYPSNACIQIIKRYKICTELKEANRKKPYLAQLESYTEQF